MRKLTTILCSIAFAVSGICLAKATSGVSSVQTVSAAEYPQFDLTQAKLPADLLLNGLAKDSIEEQVKHDTVYVEKTKLVKVHAPGKVKTKTVHVPVLYIATRTEEGTDSVGEESSHLYKVQKIGKFDPKTFNSSIDIN